MRLIKLATKAKKKEGAFTQRTIRHLKEQHGHEIVYMPYGSQGAGFYLNEVSK